MLRIAFRLSYLCFAGNAEVRPAHRDTSTTYESVSQRATNWSPLLFCSVPSYTLGRGEEERWINLGGLGAEPPSKAIHTLVSYHFVFRWRIFLESQVETVQRYEYGETATDNHSFHLSDVVLCGVCLCAFRVVYEVVDECAY